MAVDRTYRIRIETVANNAGCKEAEEGLNKTSQAAEKSGQAHDKAAEHVDKHLLSHRQLHKICHALNELVPGLGFAMQAAFSPVGATVAVSVMAMKLFHEKMKEIDEEMKKASEEAAKPLTGRLEAQREAVAESAAGMALLRDRLAEAARGERTLKDVSNEAVETMHAQIKAAASVSDALKENELAALEELHAAGLASESHYADSKLEIERQYLERKRASEEREQMTEILMRQRQVEKAEMRQPALNEEAEAAEKKREKAQTELNISKRDKAIIEEEKKKAEEEFKKWEDEHPVQAKALRKVGPQGSKEEMEGALWDTGKFGMTSAERNFEKWIEEWTRLALADEAKRKRWEKSPEEEARKQVEAERAAREAEKAGKRAEQNQEFVTEGKRDIDLKRDRFGLQHGANEQINQAGDEASRRQANAKVMEGPAGKLTRSAFEEYDAEQHGRVLDVKHQTQLAAFRRLMQAMGTNAEVILQSLEGLTGHEEAQAARMAEMARKINLLEQRQKGAFNP